MKHSNVALTGGEVEGEKSEESVHALIEVGLLCSVYNALRLR